MWCCGMLTRETWLSQIEDGNDPRDTAMYDRDDDDDSVSSGGDEVVFTQNLVNYQIPDDDDPEEADISQMRLQNTRLQSTGPGTYRLTATMSRTIPFSAASLAQQANTPNAIGSIASFISSVMAGGNAQRQEQPQGEAGDGQGGSAPRSGPPPHVHRHTFTYTGGARLHPRDSDNPGPRLEPVDDLNK